MCAMYLLVAGLGVFFMVMEPSDMDLLEAEALAMGAFYVVLGLGLTVPFLVGLVVGPARWHWVYGIVLIALGMTSICCLPVTIPLLIGWLKPEAKAWFGIR